MYELMYEYMYLACHVLVSLNDNIFFALLDRILGTCHIFLFHIAVHSGSFGRGLDWGSKGC